MCLYGEPVARAVEERGVDGAAPGDYAEAPKLEQLPPWEKDATRHRLAARAVARARERSPVVLSHQSAVALHGLPLWGVDTDEVQVTRRGKLTGRVRAGVRHHVGALRDDEVVTVDGVAVTSIARSLVELACVASYESAVVAMDAAMYKGAVTRTQLRAALLTARGWPGSGTAQAAVAFADGRSESPGESRLRVLMDNHGLPAPVLQARIETAGNAEARVDFHLPEHGVVIEFDGLVKYRDSAPDVVVAEKAREDRLRDHGLIVVRVIWAELAKPVVVVRRIEGAIERARVQRGA